MSSLRDTAPQFGLAELHDPRAQFYTSRADYKARTSKEAPPPAFDLPAKTWSLAGAGTRVTYQTYEIRDGIPQLITLSVPSAYAASVNLPPEGTLTGDLAVTAFQGGTAEPPPLVALRAEEYLALTPFGVVVRNRMKFSESVARFEEKVLERLEAISAELARLVKLLQTRGGG